MWTALTITLLASLLVYGGALWAMTPPGERRVTWFCVGATLPMCWVMYHGVRLPLEDGLQTAVGQGDALKWMRTAYAPLTEEPAKLWPLLLPWVRTAITRENVCRFALALGLGFALGEMIMLAVLIAGKQPQVAALPWHQLGGFITERFMTGSLHAGFTAVVLTAWRRGPGWGIGLFLAMAGHYLANFPISMAQWGWLGRNVGMLKTILFFWVCACFAVTTAWLAWLHFSSARAGGTTR